MLRYIELKTGYSNNGPAWIGYVVASRSGRTIYFNGRALKKALRGGIAGNYYDLESGEEFWVSSIKRNGRDRHCVGSGKVLIERRAVDEYLKFTLRTRLDPHRFEITDAIVPTDIARFNRLENEGRLSTATEL